MNTASSLDRVEKLGPRTRDTMAVLWPERVKTRISVSGYLVTNLAANKKRLRQRLRMPGACLRGQDLPRLGRSVPQRLAVGVQSAGAAEARPLGAVAAADQF